jgi:hypothetical protein
LNLTNIRDGGPLYTETLAHKSGIVVEPLNAASAALFFLIALYWLAKLRPHWRQHLFLVCMLLILAVGGIGGVLYHGLRSHRIFLFLDYFPIVLCILALSFHIWGIQKRIAFAWLLLFFIVILQYVSFRIFSRMVAINIAYALMALFVLAPIVARLRSTGFRGVNNILSGLALFCLALAFRIVDRNTSSIFPMGTHWLWHVFSAGAVWCLTLYVFQEETQGLRTDNV